MANTIQLRRSATANAVPTTTQLALGELAINTADGKIYLKKNISGTESIVEIGAGGASISVSDTSPASPINGSLWWDTTVGQLKIYYTDGTSNQWVDAVNINTVVPKATATSLGSVEIFDNTVQTVAANAVTNTASRTYGVQLNSDDQMVVNVPWSGGGGGSSPTVGQVVQSSVAPSGGTWLQTNKYYSKASYPTLAAALGDVPDIGAPVVAAKAQLPVSCSFSVASGRGQYLMATSGSAWVFGTSSSAKFIHTIDGAKFSAVPPNATINSITGVWYVNSLFVATTTPTSTGTTLLVSSDGLSWSSRTMRLAGNSTNAATSVAYNAGTYVISYDGALFYSSDLITFTQATSAPTGQYNKVIYAGGQFVAVAFGGTIVTSTNGITWTTQTSPSNQYFDVIYANGIYVAYGNFGSGSTNLVTSTNGVTWDTRFVGSGTAWQVVFGNGLFVAATTGGVYTSPTGVTWTLQTTGLISSNIRSVGYVGGIYYVGTNVNGYYATSSNGSTWTLKRDASGLGLFAFLDVNGKTVATSDAGIIILSGGDREIYQPNFSFVATLTAIDGKSVAYNGTNQYVAVSSTGLPLTSTDGENWTAQTLPSSGVMTGSASVSYLNGNYLIHGNNGATSIYTSSDGIAWTARTTPSSLGLNSVAFGASTYVAVGAGGNVFSSTDLVTWTSQSAGSSLFNDVIFANNVFVAVGAAGAIYSSSNGIAWGLRAAGANQFFRVLWAGGSINLFIAIGVGGAVYTSPDSVTWISRSAGSTQFNDIAYNSTSGTIVIVGNTGTIYSSTDGTTWTNRTLGDTTYSFGGITWDGTRFLTFPLGQTANNAAFRSTDGVTWTRTFVPSGIARLQWIGGKYIRTPSTGNQIHTSTDSFTWVQSVQNTFRVTTSLSQLQKVGNVYFTSAGFTSTDGITFNRSRSFITANVAYDGTYYYGSTKGTGSSLIVYRSSNGNDWSYLTELGTNASTTLQPTFWQDMLYANGKLVTFTAGYIFSTSTDVASVYYSTDGITWTPGQFPAGGYPGTLSASGSGVVATDGTTLIAAATTTSTSYGMYKSTNGGATWTSFFGSTFAPIMYTGGYWYWQSFKTADASTVTSAPTVTLTAVGSHNGYGFNIFGTGAQIWEATLNNNNGVPRYAIFTPGAYGLIAGTKPAPIRTSDNRVLTMANIGSLAGTMTNPISEFPLFSYDTATTFFVPQQVTGLASNEYIYAGA
jgi:hypothetical protein